MNLIELLKLQNRRAKWRKREPPRKTGYIGSNNSPSTQLTGPPLHPSGSFTTFQQPTTVTPPNASVDSWTSYQQYGEIGTHFNLLSPTASPYSGFTGQYGTYVHDNQLFSVRHFDYGSPSRVTNGAPQNVIDQNDGHQHKSDHYTSIDGHGNDG